MPFCIFLDFFCIWWFSRFFLRFCTFFADFFKKCGRWAHSPPPKWTSPIIVPLACCKTPCVLNVHATPPPGHCPTPSWFFGISRPWGRFGGRLMCPYLFIRGKQISRAPAASMLHLLQPQSFTELWPRNNSPQGWASSSRSLVSLYDGQWWIQSRKQIHISSKNWGIVMIVTHMIHARSHNRFSKRVPWKFHHREIPCCTAIQTFCLWNFRTQDFTEAEYGSLTKCSFPDHTFLCNPSSLIRDLIFVRLKVFTSGWNNVCVCLFRSEAGTKCSQLFEIQAISHFTDSHLKREKVLSFAPGLPNCVSPERNLCKSVQIFFVNLNICVKGHFLYFCIPKKWWFLRLGFYLLYITEKILCVTCVSQKNYPAMLWYVFSECLVFGSGYVWMYFEVLGPSSLWCAPTDSCSCLILAMGNTEAVCSTSYTCTTFCTFFTNSFSWYSTAWTLSLEEFCTGIMLMQKHQKRVILANRSQHASKSLQCSVPSWGSSLNPLVVWMVHGAGKSL